MLNSKTGNGLSDTILSGLKALFRSTGGKNNELTVRKMADGVYYIMDGNDPFAGPYRRESDAKGQLTRYLKGYTAASRRPVATTQEA